MFNKIRKNKKGFTLAELLIVVAIVAVLTAIAIPVFKAQLDKATVATHRSNSRSIHGEAVASYLVDDETPKTTSYTGKLEGIDYTWTIDAGEKTATVTHSCDTTDCPETWTFSMDSGLAPTTSTSTSI